MKTHELFKDLFNSGIYDEAIKIQFKKEIAKILIETPGLDGEELGKFLIKNKEIFINYVEEFSFPEEERFIDSLRKFIESFKMPTKSTSKDVSMVLERFGIFYISSLGPERSPRYPFSNTDAVEILCYSILMLQTNQHYPCVEDQHRMNVNDFIKMCKGINGDKDFSAEFLTEIYNEVKKSRFD